MRQMHHRLLWEIHEPCGKLWIIVGRDSMFSAFRMGPAGRQLCTNMESPNHSPAWFHISTISWFTTKAWYERRFDFSTISNPSHKTRSNQGWKSKYDSISSTTFMINYEIGPGYRVVIVLMKPVSLIMRVSLVPVRISLLRSSNTKYLKVLFKI